MMYQRMRRGFEVVSGLMVRLLWPVMALCGCEAAPALGEESVPESGMLHKRVEPPPEMAGPGGLEAMDFVIDPAAGQASTVLSDGRTLYFDEKGFRVLDSEGVLVLEGTLEMDTGNGVALVSGLLTLTSENLGTSEEVAFDVLPANNEQVELIFTELSGPTWSMLVDYPELASNSLWTREIPPLPAESGSPEDGSTEPLMSGGCWGVCAACLGAGAFAGAYCGLCAGEPTKLSCIYCLESLVGVVASCSICYSCLNPTPPPPPPAPVVCRLYMVNNQGTPDDPCDDTGLYICSDGSVATSMCFGWDGQPCGCPPELYPEIPIEPVGPPCE